MKRLLLLSIILLSACDRQIPFDAQGSNKIPFDAQGSNNSYLGCSSNNELRYRWRNVILDNTNQSVRSEWYFIASGDFIVMQYGAIFVLNDNYDGSAYEWGEHKGKISETFKLHKTTLNLDVVERITYDYLDDTYNWDEFRCNVYDDYQSYSKWENSILEELAIEAIRQKIESKKTEANKKI